MAYTPHFIIDPDTGRKVRVPGATTVLKYIGDHGGLKHWCFTQGKEAARLEIEEEHEPINGVWNMPKTAADIGTIAHNMIEHHAVGKEFDESRVPPDILEPAKVAFSGYLRWKKRRSLEILGTEIELTSTKWRYGGTIDYVMMDGERTLLDWKTGSGIYAENVMQIAAYLELWRENREEEIDTVAIVRLDKEDGGITDKDWPADSPKIKWAWKGFRAALVAHEIFTKRLKKI